MKKNFLLVLGFLFFSGCATTAGYEQLLNSWVGTTDRELIAAWGAPDSVYEFDKTQKVIAYHKGGTVYHPGIEPTYRTTKVGDTVVAIPVGGMPPQVNTYSCKTDFTITNGLVSQWRWEGNNCRVVANKTKTPAVSSSSSTGVMKKPA